MTWRYRLIFFFLLLAFIVIIIRLFYWQVVKAQELTELAKSQYASAVKILPKRGEIKTSDGFPLASNKISYLVFANPKEIKNKDETSTILYKILKIDQASVSAQLSLDRFWVPLKADIDPKVKDEIESLQLQGIGFEQQFSRFYPEASQAAHLLGFVGKNETGEDKGYFGLEGYYDRLLAGKEEYVVSAHDALGKPILSQMRISSGRTDGSNLILTIERPLQFLVEKKLKRAIEQYGAEGGMVGIMDPKTGSILTMVSFPSFDPSNWPDYSQDLYKNPFISDTYEPGSTLKPIIMASALDAQVVLPQTKCPICGGPVTIGDYEMHTWNNKYTKDITMIDTIVRSDNTGMVFVAQKLGLERMTSYLQKFLIWNFTSIDLQGESAPSQKPKNLWYPVDLATVGFGQGISVTPIELLSAFSAIANKGRIMQPHVVSKIESFDGKIATLEQKAIVAPISEKTAKIMTEILVNAVDKGESSWAKPRGYRIAGKTGTASIPVAGHYDPSKTIASFIGFAPADDPKFIMLVILNKPTTSIYGAETAAPLFFDLARDLLSYYGIPPSE